MKKPKRTIDWCKLSEDIDNDPLINIAEFLPGKVMLYVSEMLMYREHVKKCEKCTKHLDNVEARAPKPTLEDYVKNEN